MKKRYGVLVAFALLLLILSGCRREIPEVKLQLNGVDINFAPAIYDYSRGASGSYWDSTANQLPCLSVSQGDKISVVGKVRHGEQHIVTKFAVLDPNKPLGSSEAKSEFESFNVVDNGKDTVSFTIDRIGPRPLLIVCEAREHGTCTHQVVFLLEEH